MSVTIIDSFSGPYFFLSNFYRMPIEYQGAYYRTIAYAFEASKTSNFTRREQIRNAPTMGKARRLGRDILLAPEWTSSRVPIMRILLELKFSAENQTTRQLLLDTKDYHLIKGNNWGDTFWGVCEGKGENMLGRLLMNIREEIRAEQ